MHRERKREEGQAEEGAKRQVDATSMFVLLDERGFFFLGYRGRKEIWDPDQALILTSPELLNEVLSSLEQTREFLFSFEVCSIHIQKGEHVIQRDKHKGQQQLQ